MHNTSLEIDGIKYWISAITGEVISKELILERHPSTSEPLESVFIVDSSGKEHSVEIGVLTSEFRKGSKISLIYLSNRESRSGKLGLVYNHDTKKMTGDYDQLRSIRRRYSRPLMLLTASLSCAAVVYFGSTDHPVITALLALATIPISAAIMFVLYMNSSYFMSWLERRRLRAFLNNDGLLSWVTREAEIRKSTAITNNLKLT